MSRVDLSDELDKYYCEACGESDVELKSEEFESEPTLINGGSWEYVTVDVQCVCNNCGNDALFLILDVGADLEIQFERWNLGVVDDD